MVVGRKEISVLLLAIGALLFFGVFLLSASSDAQTGSDCPGAQEVNTTTGNGDKQSPVFDITGTSFRLTVDSTATSEDPQFAGVSIFVFPEGETVDFAGDFSVEEGRDDSSIINAGPGQFYLDVIAANVDYTITVEDCTGSGSAGGGGSTGAERSVNPSPAQNSGAQAKAGNGGASAESSRERQRRNVRRDTVPNRRLPPTGGLPVSGSVVVTGFVVVGAGLLGLGLVRRNGRRR